MQQEFKEYQLNKTIEVINFKAGYEEKFAKFEKKKKEELKKFSYMTQEAVKKLDLM